MRLVVLRGLVLLGCGLGTLACIPFVLELRQDNQESLFLAAESLERYERFQAEVPERPEILVRVDFPDSIPEGYWPRFLERAAKLRAEPDLEVVDFSTTYGPAVPGPELEPALAFVAERPGLLFDLLGKNHLAFVILLNPTRTTIENEALIDELLTDPTLLEGELAVAGLPHTNYLLNLFSEQIKPKLFPSMLILGLLFSILVSRSLRGGIVIFLPSVFSLVGSLAVIRVLHGTMNMVTSITPLLIFVINLTLCYHLYFAAAEMGGLGKALRLKALPLLLMVITTSVGFGALAFSEIQAIQQLGILSAVLIVGTTIPSVGWLWAIFHDNSRFLRPPPLLVPPRFFRKTLHPAVVWVGSAAVLLGAALVFPHLPVNTNAVTYFPASSGLTQQIQELQAKTLCNPNFEILLHPQIETDTDVTATWARVAEFERRLDVALGGRMKLLSRQRITNEAWQIASSVAALPDTPATRSMVTKALPEFLLELYPQSDRYRITVLGKATALEDYLPDQKLVDDLLIEFADLNGEINGIFYNLQHSQDALVAILARSFTLSLAVIAAIFLLFFRRFSLLLLFLFPNLIPPLAALLFLRGMGFSLNVATVMVFSVSLGIIVDSTLHVFHALRPDQWKGFDFYFKTTLVPLLSSSLLLTLSFAMFGIHGFLPIQQFGLTLSFVVLLALVLDLFALPTLVCGTHYKQLCQNEEE